jgi:Rrf2 family protein
MLDLALHYGEGPISLKSVAERQDISEPYLEQLAAGLRKAGLVQSIRGAQGGYVLAREPAAVTVGQVIRALEGPIAPRECVREERPEPCRRAKTCVARSVWAKLRDCMNEVLDSITLEDMCLEAAKFKESNAYMYYI